MTNTISSIIDLTNAPTPPRWFEFLLEPGRLQQHLETRNCDPSPTQLITLFFRNMPNLESGSSNQSPNQNKIPSNNNTQQQQQQSTNSNNSDKNATPNSTNSPHSPDDTNNVNGSSDQLLETALIDYSDSAEIQIPPDSYEAKYRTKKAYAMQILAIKVASYLKWDLNTLCSNLTIPVQYKLMQALNNACSSKSCPDELKKFADVLYSHWFLYSAITYQMSALQPQSNNTTIIYLSQLQQQQQAADTNALSNMGEVFAPTSKQLQSCKDSLKEFIDQLVTAKEVTVKRAKTTNHPFMKAKLTRPLMDCFDSRDEHFNDWNKKELIESKSFMEEACYDLGRFFFFEESYATAKHMFEIIKDSTERFPKLQEYLCTSTELTQCLDSDNSSERGNEGDKPGANMEQVATVLRGLQENRSKTEKYLFDCMTKFSKNNQQADMTGENKLTYDALLGDSDLRFENNATQSQPCVWYIQAPSMVQQQHLMEASRGDMLMAKGNFRQAMGAFVGCLMLMTDYFREFSKDYIEEEPYISRMIQCSISLSCYTEAVTLCQMSKNMNYTIAFKQLNERVCNDCCDDIYECIWNITLLEYIIHLHSRRGEIERRTRVTQLIGQLELNENNPEHILREAEHVRRGKFFRILANKYL